MGKWYPLGDGNSVNFDVMGIRDTHIEDAPVYTIKRDNRKDTIWWKLLGTCKTDHSPAKTITHWSGFQATLNTRINRCYEEWLADKFEQEVLSEY